MSAWDSAYWDAVRDDALSEPPVWLDCDACGRRYPVAADEPDDEVRLCGRCTLAVVRAVTEGPPLLA